VFQVGADYKPLSYGLKAMKAHIPIHVADEIHTETSMQGQLPDPQHYIINNCLKNTFDTIILVRV
jgi:hypothetical protein